MKIRNFKNLSLKKALVKTNFPKSKSLNLRSKSINDDKNKKNSRNSYIIKDNKDSNNFDSFDFDLDLKNESDLAEKIYKANQLKIKENKIEDEEINSLNEQIRQIMLKNFEIQTSIQKQLNLRYIYEKNQKKIASYINDLNYKFRNYDQTIRNYENSIYKMKRENKDLQNQYDKKIEDIEKENEKLKKRIRDRIELYMHQKGQIDEKSVKTQNLENEIQAQKDTIKERVDMNKRKVDELEDKYDKINKKLIDMEVNCDDEKILKLFQSSLYTIEENQQKKEKDEKENDEEKESEVKDLHQKIENCEMNNDALVYELKELNKEYEKLTKNKDNNKDNNRDKRQRYSFGSTMRSSSSNLMKDTQSENRK